jgi:hypothetical protein
MARLASIRALLSCNDDASAGDAVATQLEALGPMLIDCQVDAVMDYEVLPGYRAGAAFGRLPAEAALPDAVHLEVRKGHLQLATDDRVVMDFGAGHFSAHLDDAAHIARCLNAHHALVAALRDAMHHLTLAQAGQQTPQSTAQIIEVLGRALTAARTPAVIETIATPLPSAGPEALAAL